ncbi:MAG: stage V sporulation protein S [Chloroflexi bacterium]|jgi:stage V sporulation protein S|nr:stage V sporulation protein S [Chloroflexota bacterium]
MEIMRVASTSSTTALAGAIAWRVRQEGEAEMEAIGAGAVNQAIKAVAVARTFVALDGLDLGVVPHFATVETLGERRSALRLRICSWTRALPAAEPAGLAVAEAC